MEIDRIRAGDERAVVMIGIKQLHGERFPAAGRAAIDEARPALADAAKLLFDRRDQFGFDGVAIGADVGRIDRVGIVIERIGMLQLHDQQARRAGRNPGLIVLVGLLLLMRL